MENTKAYLNALIERPLFNHQAANAEPLNVEVVVPVYDGHEALQKCAHALLEHTDPAINITFLDDASTDPRNRRFLHQLAKDHPQIHCICRPQNLGYLHNVNQHLSGLNADVVLLNSDTEVTSGWLKELCLVAQNEQVGMVCPLSNHATILSLNLASAEDLSHLSELSGHWFPIPTAVGFCVLIKKSIHEKLGGFDPFYHPGYGEECDYSMELRNAGMQIACAAAAYVKHQGSQSFAAQAKPLQLMHEQLLHLRWPAYHQEVRLHAALNPVVWIEQHLSARATEKPRVLHVVHGIDNKGGVELFTRELITRFDQQMVHCLLVPKRAHPKSQSSIPFDYHVIELDAGALKHKTAIFNQVADLNHAQLDRHFKGLLLAGQFKVVHFHSLVGVGTNIWPLICAALNIPYVLSFHDHKGLCPIFSLSQTQDDQEVFCGMDRAEPNNPTCLNCLKQKTLYTNQTTGSYVLHHQQIWQQAMQQAALVLFPSQYLLRQYTLTNPNIKGHSAVLEPCFEAAHSRPSKAPKSARIKAAFLGQFGIIKGAQLFIDLYHQWPNNQVDFTIIGGVEPRYQAQLEQTNIRCTGPYHRHQLGILLADVDVVVFTAQVPETYGITLTEAAVHGVPVIAPNLGVYPDRIVHEKNGLLYDHNNLDDLLATLHHFIKLQQKHHFQCIQYQPATDLTPDQLTQRYRQAAANADHHISLTHGGIAQHFGPMLGSAYATMQRWLDAPNTLEAAADWHVHSDPVGVMILGEQADWLALTRQSIDKQLSTPIYLDDLTALQGDWLHRPLMLIDAGNQVNDNLGNWLSQLVAQSQPVSLSDFCLVNRRNQFYAPQFMGTFSWLNHQLHHQAVGCLLIKPSALGLDVIHQAVTKTNPLKWLVKHCSQANQVSHFPHFSYSMLDQKWVQNLKTSQAQQRPQPAHTPKRPIRVLVVLETNAPPAQQSRQIKALQQQIVMDSNWGQCLVSSTAALQQHINNAPRQDPTPDVVVVMRDNVRFGQPFALQSMLHSLLQSGLDAATIPAAQAHQQHFVVGKKMGVAHHFHGIGRIHDLRFTAPGDWLACDLLDDDFMVFKAKAWSTIRSHISGMGDYYQALKLSALLQQYRHRLGMYLVPEISKKGLPLMPTDGAVPDLKQQRQHIIDAGLNVFQQRHHPRAYGARSDTDLDWRLCAFKTPKTLPRVIGFAHDDWASGFLRVKSPLSALAANNQASVMFLPTGRHKVTPTAHEIHAMQADALLLHGFFDDQQLAALWQYHKQLSCRIIISMDDLLTAIPAYNPAASKIPADIEKRIQLSCQLADHLVVSTPRLANLLAGYHDHITVIPNRLSKAVWHHPRRPKKSDRKPRVGWAGAGQHQGDLAFLQGVVQQTQQHIQWVFFGDQPAGLKAANIEFHPPVPLMAYADKLSSLDLDLAVAPLLDNEFNRCKSTLKLLEYGTLALPVLASDVVCYHHTPARLLPNDVDTWVKTLGELLDQPKQRLQLGQSMQQWAIEHQWLEDCLSPWVKLLRLGGSQAQSGL